MDTPEKGERRIDIRCNKQSVVRIEIRTTRSRAVWGYGRGKSSIKKESRIYIRLTMRRAVYIYGAVVVGDTVVVGIMIVFLHRPYMNTIVFLHRICIRST